MEIPKTICTIQELKKLEVINLCDGKKMGAVCDVEMDLFQGSITALILPKPFDIKEIFQSEETKMIRIPWHRIERIGSDTILVRFQETRT
ncbi:MAG: YlmC/YmxH family sporulation protein [Clostridia bacterium]|nr:YlmC/YmxH family sporulation protein [Clostridia bacterium]